MKHFARMAVFACAFAIVAAFSVTPASAATKTKDVSCYSYWKSLAGITVTKHWSTTTFSYTGSRLTTPKGLEQSWWTLPPTFKSSTGAGWSWYTTSSKGTGRSKQWVEFVTGVPTPWGPIGSTFKDGHRVDVKYTGSYSRTYY